MWTVMCLSLSTQRPMTTLALSSMLKFSAQVLLQTLDTRKHGAKAQVPGSKPHYFVNEIKKTEDNSHIMSWQGK